MLFYTQSITFHRLQWTRQLSAFLSSTLSKTSAIFTFERNSYGLSQKIIKPCITTIRRQYFQGICYYTKEYSSRLPTTSNFQLNASMQNLRLDPTNLSLYDIVLIFYFFYEKISTFQGSTLSQPSLTQGFYDIRLFPSHRSFLWVLVQIFYLFYIWEK